MQLMPDLSYDDILMPQLGREHSALKFCHDKIPRLQVFKCNGQDV